MNKKKTLLIGAHMSVEGGLEKSIGRGESIGCTAIQIFTKSNRQWFAKDLTEEEISLFKETTKKSLLKNITAHACYLINLASATERTRALSINALTQELQRCEQLGIEYLVLHPGSHGGQGRDKGAGLISEGIDKAFGKSPGRTMVLLETMAGQGTSIGSSFEDIALIRAQSAHAQRIGVCLDTCHVFAAGYDISNKDSYEQIWKKFDATIGLAHLRVIHVNDSKGALGSRLDRHEDIGKGAVGLSGFTLLFNDTRFFDIPKILETPKESPEDDRRNMNALKDLLTQNTKEKFNLK